MKICAWLWLITIAPALQTQGQEKELQEKELQSLKNGALEITAALAKNDHEKIVDLTHPLIVEKIGGRKKMIEYLEKNKSSASNLVDIKIEQPKQIVKSKEEMFGIVTFAMVFKSKSRRGTYRSFVVGFSKDGGKKWVYVDGGTQGEAKIRELFPNIPKELIFPAREAPKIEKVD